MKTDTPVLVTSNSSILQDDHDMPDLPPAQAPTVEHDSLIPFEVPTDMDTNPAKQPQQPTTPSLPHGPPSPITALIKILHTLSNQ